VIYFIDPFDPESLKFMIDDFKPDDQDEFSYDQYGAVHICFSSSLNNKQLKKDVITKIMA